MIIIKKSNAKVNLNLLVSSQKIANYHLIDSLFYPVFDCYDTLTFKFISSKQAKISLASPLSEFPDFKNNLIFKTFWFLQKKFNFTCDCQVNIVKQIPIASGLGGGSSNAFFTLQAVCDYLKIKLTLPLLTSVSQALGTDIMFFYYNTLSRVQNIGDKVKIIPHVNFFTIKLFFNQCQLLTKDVYAAYDQHYSDNTLWLKRDMIMQKIINKINNKDISFVNDLHNDLLAPAFLVNSQLKTIYHQLSMQNKTLLSGSGGTFFTINKN